jgi:LysR family nitrogen assimilation transcriptional regulator
VAVEYVETRGVVSQRMTTEAFYLIAWLKFPMPEDPGPLAALARMPLPR